MEEESELVFINGTFPYCVTSDIVKGYVPTSFIVGLEVEYIAMQIVSPPVAEQEEGIQLYVTPGGNPSILITDTVSILTIAISGKGNPILAIFTVVS